MNNTTVRVRFAPAPTGMMHLGNIRTALMNYLFAKQKNGSLILRIEDTDAQRNYDPNATKIIEDLEWLGITFDEGAGKGGPCEPYFQSQRTAIYQQKLDALVRLQKVYRCFCTQEELEKKRERQKMLLLPPRYDRTCVAYTQDDINLRLENNSPFVWRLYLDHEQKIVIHDLGHGDVHFELKNFSDFPLTRQDGSFTFMFANFVDDMTMSITHVFRGEDHLSNTAGQAALYSAFNSPLPIFFHMPIICNLNGTKLSKRDFGFSFRDLINTGFTPEAIANYLAIIGGSFEQEIMSLDQLVYALNFEKMQTTGHIKYDFEKLRWINHKWISSYSPAMLAKRCIPFLKEQYPALNTISCEQISNLLTKVQTDLTTLADSIDKLRFYFQKPAISAGDLEAVLAVKIAEKIKKIIFQHYESITSPDQFLTYLKASAKTEAVPLKSLFLFLRLALTGACEGLSVLDLMIMLGSDEAKDRINYALSLIQ